MVTNAVHVAFPPWRSVTNDRVAWQAIAIAIAVITSCEYLVRAWIPGRASVVPH